MSAALTGPCLVCIFYKPLEVLREQEGRGLGIGVVGSGSGRIKHSASLPAARPMVRPVLYVLGSSTVVQSGTVLAIMATPRGNSEERLSFNALQ